MRLPTSRGRATVGQLCEAFGISRQAYHAARNAPQRESTDIRTRPRRPEREGPWVSDATLIEKIKAVVTEFPAELEEALTDFLRASRSANTHRAYRAALKAFAAFCEANARDALPVRPATVAGYLAHQARQGRRPSTLAVHVAAIAYAHRVGGHPNPCDAPAVREVVRGIRRTLGVGPKQASALTLPRLGMVLHGIDRGTVRGKRDAALLTLGFALAARRSELVALDVEDLEDDGDGLFVRIARSKSDQEGEGALLYVPRAQQILEVCAVRATRAWLECGVGTSGPLFRSVRKGGALGGRLSARAVDLVVRGACSAIADGASFSAHSLRAGLVTTLASQGRTELQIMEQSRHKSSAMVRVYARSSDAKRASPLTGAW